jgi:ElaB/YqjD/DUF883 family membrane-anchored ribosome-binding protein
VFFSHRLKTRAPVVVYRGLQETQEVDVMIRTIVAGVAAVLCVSTGAIAQSTSDPLEHGQGAGLIREFKLHDVREKEVAGAETVQLAATASAKTTGRPHRDSVWNGVLIGAGVGALAGFGLGRSFDSPACPRSGIECGQGAFVGTVGGAFWGAISGWIADALIHDREAIASPQKRR